MYKVLADKFEHEMASVYKIIRVCEQVNITMQGLASSPNSIIQSFLSCFSIELWKEVIQAVGPLGVVHALHAVIPSQEIVQYCLCSGSVQQRFQLKRDIGVQAHPSPYSGGGGEELTGVQANQSLLLFFKGRLGEGKAFMDVLLWCLWLIICRKADRED